MPEGLPPTVDVPRAPRGRAGLAWIAIVLAVGAIFAAGLFAKSDPGNAERMAVATLETQARVLVGAGELSRLGGSGGPAPVQEVQVRALEQGPPLLRLRVAVVAGDLLGARAARDSLERLRDLVAEHGRTLTPEETATLAALDRLYAGPDDEAPHGDPARLTDAGRAALEEHLGWTGRLALAPAGLEATKATREEVVGGTKLVAGLLVGGAVLGVLLLLAGTVGLIAFLFMVGTRRTPLHFATFRRPGGVWAETFAVWLIGFYGVSILVGLVLPEDAGLLGALIAQCAGLGALAWPRFRGLGWARIREDVGLRSVAHPIVEVLAGVAGWVLALPIVAAGILVTAALALGAAALQGGDLGPFGLPPSPGHPVQLEMAGGTSAVLLLLVAAVAAPVTEEIFFRGVLYRHLREASAGRRRAISIALSTAVTGVVFAAIHPQGWIAIPALAAISTGLVLVREWRDGLIAPIAYHALHNGLLVGGSLLLMG